MRWWLGRPDGVAEWVNSSLLSSLILGKLWFLSIYLMLFTDVFKMLVISGSLMVGLALAALATHGLLWWQVLRGGWALLQDANPSSAGLLLGAVLWLKALLGFQLLCLLGWYCLTAPATNSPPWLQF